MPHGQVEEVLEYLIQQEYDGVVTLEMFSEEDVFGSTEMVREILEVNGWAG
jgi:sugar phosphate isomerase/epimerase